MGGFLFGSAAGILLAEVFNMFVENAVEKDRSDSVSGSWRDASAVCTGVRAGTFVVEPASRLEHASVDTNLKVLVHLLKAEN